MTTESGPFTPAVDRSQRAIIGIRVSSGLDRITGVLGCAAGRGLACRFEVKQSAVRRPSKDTVDQFGRLSQEESVAAGSLVRLVSEITELEVELVRELASHGRYRDVIALGVHEPGLWFHIDGQPLSRISLCDTARLAESTGLTVIDDFPARDLAQGGRGGPIEALAQWILLHDPLQCRLVVDLGRTVRITYLPPKSTDVNGHRVTAFDVGPGMALLDQLTSRLTNGAYAFDPGGRLAVQGRQIPELLSRLLEAPFFSQSPPHWHPYGVCPDWFLEESIRVALDSGGSMRDLLCTAIHLIAESLARAIENHLPKTPPVDQMILTGGGQQNGFLLREISRRLPLATPLRLEDLGLGWERLDAASIAVLTLLHLDQVPQAHSLITGATASRVLGRLTPGTPRSWHQLLSEISQNRPATMSLRNAV